MHYKGKQAINLHAHINVHAVSCHYLRAVYTRVFCVRCPVRDGASAQQSPLLFSRDHVRGKAKEAIGQRRHHGRRNDAKNASVDGPLTHVLDCFSVTFNTFEQMSLIRGMH
jgi:hypothetical protein